VAGRAGFSRTASCAAADRRPVRFHGFNWPDVATGHGDTPDVRRDHGVTTNGPGPSTPARSRSYLTRGQLEPGPGRWPGGEISSRCRSSQVVDPPARGGPGQAGHYLWKRDAAVGKSGRHLNLLGVGRARTARRRFYGCPTSVVDGGHGEVNRGRRSGKAAPRPATQPTPPPAPRHQAPRRRPPTDQRDFFLYHVRSNAWTGGFRVR